MRLHCPRRWPGRWRCWSAWAAGGIAALGLGGVDGAGVGLRGRADLAGVGALPACWMALLALAPLTRVRLVPLMVTLPPVMVPVLVPLRVSTVGAVARDARDAGAAVGHIDHEVVVAGVLPFQVTVWLMPSGCRPWHRQR